MKNELKRKILLARLDGYNTRATGKMVGCSYQSVSNYLGTLPVPEGFDPSEKVPYHGFDKNICQIISNTLPGHEDNLDAVCEETHLDKVTVETAIKYIVSKKARVFDQSRNPLLNAWIRRNGISLQEFSELMGISTSTMRSILDGTHVMTLKIAKQLKDVTGLSLRELLLEHMDEIESYYLNESSFDSLAEDDSFLKTVEVPVAPVAEDTIPVLAGRSSPGSTIIKPPRKKR